MALPKHCWMNFEDQAGGAKSGFFIFTWNFDSGRTRCILSNLTLERFRTLFEIGYDEKPSPPDASVCTLVVYLDYLSRVERLQTGLPSTEMTKVWSSRDRISYQVGRVKEFQRDFAPYCDTYPGWIRMPPFAGND